MELKLFWTEFAQRELKNIYDYYREKAGHRISKTIVDGIYSETLRLEKQPKIGQIKELLTDREQEFRYFVHNNYKVIY
jgi:plasmid stabilization system protein ParE